MMNDCNFIGRITKDPELSATASGSNYTRFCIAVDKPNKDKDGNKGTDFIDCVAWGKKAESIATYLKKGSLVGVSGRLETSIYEKNGEKRKVSDILVISIDFLDKPESKPQETTPEQPIIEDMAEDGGSLPFAL